MSFSKAKIQRFNDVKPYTPGPTAYNAITKNKKTSACSQSERNVEQAGSPSVSESGSVQSVPCRFRTPILPKKKKTTTSTVKSKQLFGESNDSEALKEKIVECENKDAFIKSLTEEIEELKNKISSLNDQKRQLDFQKQEMERKIINLKADYENENKKLMKEFEEDINKVTQEKLKVSNEMTLMKQQYEDLRVANKKEMNDLKDNCDKFSTLYNKSVEECNNLIKEKDLLLKNKETELKVLESNCIEIQRKHSMEIEKLRKEHQIEIQDIEFEILKTMTELQKEKEQASNKIKEIDYVMKKAIEDLKRNFDEEREQLLFQYEDKIKQVAEQVKKDQEYQMHEKLEEMENKWKTKLDIQRQQSNAILQECQTISEYNIIQCELEKKNIETKLIDKTKELESHLLQYRELATNYEDLKSKYETLQCDFSKSIGELKRTNDTLSNALHNKGSELKSCLEENRAYVITIKSFQNTVEVLKRRLINSDRDVEQLKMEVSENETKLLEYENKCIQLASDLKQAQSYNEGIEMQHETAVKLNTDEIQQLKTELLERVENYRKEVETFSKKLVDSEEAKKEIMQQLHEAFEVIEKLKMEFECFEAINCQYEFEIDQSRNELEDYRIREIDWNNLKEKLEHTVNELESILEIKQDEVTDYKKQIVQLEEKCESYVHHTNYYKNKVREYERELDDTEKIHKKYIEQSGKYDELLQKFEQLERENLEKQREIAKLSKNCQDKENYVEKCNQQKGTYDVLLKKYEQLEKENSWYKKKADEQSLLKNRLDQTEEEKDVLLGRIKYLEDELKELSDKYADLAGHQNNKQKIKHFVDLKTKNEELVQVNEDLFQANLDLELKMRSQQKTMEKLKKENADLKKCMRKSKLHPEDKENIGSPNRSLNSSRVESPFRERN